MTDALKGKVAAITGGGSGIGKAIAIAMAAEGAKIVVGDIGKDAEGKYTADHTVELIHKDGGSAVASYGDITTMAGGESLIQAAINTYGRIDALVNCAGFTREASILEDNEKNWDDIIAANLKGHFACTHFAVKEMAKQKCGSIINFSSRAGFTYSIPGPGICSMPYSAAKAGVVGVTIMCAVELREHGITCNAILPSAVTPGFSMTRPKFGGGKTEGPEMIAPVVAYLASDEAKNITGQFFYVSSGDVAVLAPPLQLQQADRFIHKEGIWTVEELSKEIPPLVYKVF